MGPLTTIEVETTNNRIRANLEHLLLNFPKSYNRDLIEENIETHVDTMCGTLSIDYHDYEMVNLIWRYTTLKYLDRLINSFEHLDENGYIPRIKPLKYIDVFISAWREKYANRHKIEAWRQNILVYSRR